MRRTSLIAVVLAAGLAVLHPAAAVAKDGDVRVSNRCTAGSLAKLKLSAEDGRLEVEGEVDQNRNGVRWQWQLRVSGALVARGVGLTRAPSGSFEVRRLVPDRAGAEAVVFRASRSGESCVVQARWG